MPDFTEILKEHNLEHWECISETSNEWWRRIDGIEYTYEGIGSIIDQLKNIDSIEPVSKE